MLKVFIGYDRRVPLTYNVMQHSIVRHACKPVSITPLIADQLPIQRFGLTEFTFSRFLVPWLCKYSPEPAIFVDPDMVVTHDIHDLVERALEPSDCSVYVNKEQPEFEYPSVMVFRPNLCQMLTPEWVNDRQNNPYHMDQWVSHGIGAFDPRWNHCVGYQPSRTDAYLYHYTTGVPAFPEVRGLPEDEFWDDEQGALTEVCGWADIMGRSVHAPRVIKRMLSRYGVTLKEQAA